MKTDARETLAAAAKEYLPSQRKWSDRENEILTLFYNRVPLPLLCEQLGRSRESVKSRAQRIKDPRGS
jgi:hypothetical protein